MAIANPGFSQQRLRQLEELEHTHNMTSAEYLAGGRAKIPTMTAELWDRLITFKQDFDYNKELSALNAQVQEFEHRHRMTTAEFLESGQLRIPTEATEAWLNLLLVKDGLEARRIDEQLGMYERYYNLSTEQFAAGKYHRSIEQKDKESWNGLISAQKERQQARAAAAASVFNP